MKNILQIGFSIFILLSTYQVFAINEEFRGMIEGTVTTADGKPAEMVTVSIKGTKRATLTDANGYFLFRNMPNGTYTLQFSLVGNETREKEVVIENDKNITVDFQLDISNKQLSEVIVRAIGKRPHDLSSDYVAKMPLKNIENPQVYSSIGKTILDNQLLYTVDEGLRNVTGIQKMWSATNRAGDGGAFLNLRGFIVGNSLRNGFAAPVTTSMDAVNIEKFEVLKGPSATFFGSNITSYGGAVNRVTKRPYNSLGGNVSLSGGSNNFYRVQADINTPLTKDNKLLFRLNGAYTNDGTFQKKDAKNNYVAITPALTYKPNEKLEINLEYEHYYTKAVPEQAFFYLTPALGVNNMKDLEKAGLDYKNSYVGSGLYTKANVRNVFGQINYKINKYLRSSTNVNSAYSQSNGFNPYFAVAPLGTITQKPEDMATLGVVRADQSTANSKKTWFQIQQNFNADFNIGSVRNRAVAGFDYLKTKDNQVFAFFFPFDWVPFSGADYNNMNSTTVKQRYDAGTGIGSWLQSGVLNTYSGYIADVVTPADGLNIMASIRYESNNFKGGKLGTNDNPAYTQAAWSPKLGIVYEIVKDKFSVFTNYQNSFNSRGYFISDNKGTSSLSTPETANQFEGGFKTNILNGKLNAVLSYYNIDVKNSILTTLEPVLDNEGKPIPNQFVQNQAGKLRSKGIELEVDAYLVKGFSLIGGVSYNDTKYLKADADAEGLRPNTASSPWLVNFNASYQFLDGKIKGLGFGIGGNYASDNKIVNSNSQGSFILPKYFVLNANAFYDLKRFRVGVKADNFTNEHYWLGYTTANPQRLMNILGSVTFKF